MTVDETKLLHLVTWAAELIEKPVMTPEEEAWLEEYDAYMDKDDDQPTKYAHD